MHFRSSTMNKECRAYLKTHIQVRLEKEPDLCVKQLQEWILSSEQKFDLQQLRPDTLFKFINRNMAMFRDLGPWTGRMAAAGPTSGATSVGQTGSTPGAA
jgi:hypothetical protein